MKGFPMAMVLGIGSVVHVGDWSGVVESISRDGVVLKLGNGKRLAVARAVIEEAVLSRKS
jgi:ABC-type transport system involved in cytochrome bd biosynthesis fused ATPase/permease subunit